LCSFLLQLACKNSQILCNWNCSPSSCRCHCCCCLCVLLSFFFLLLRSTSHSCDLTPCI
jgi:hypothetical protein